jgi:hypothetical protein
MTLFYPLQFQVIGTDDRKAAGTAIGDDDGIRFEGPLSELYRTLDGHTYDSGGRPWVLL